MGGSIPPSSNSPRDIVEMNMSENASQSYTYAGVSLPA